MSSAKNKKILKQNKLRENPNANKSYYQQIVDEIDYNYDWSNVNTPFARAKKIANFQNWSHKFIGMGLMLLYFCDQQEENIKKDPEFIADRKDLFTFLTTSTLQIEQLPIDVREEKWEELYELVYDIDIDMLKLDANMDIIRKLIKQK